MAEKIPKDVKVTLELKTKRGWNNLEGSEKDKKVWESLELPRDLLNGFAHNAVGNMDSNTTEHQTAMKHDIH